MRNLLSDVVDEKVVAKIGRLEKSINRMMDHIDAVASGEAEDSALRVTTDQEASNLALAGVKLNQEDYYIHTTSDLVDKLCVDNFQVSMHDVVQMTSKFKLKGNQEYHKAVKTGRCSQVQKYSEKAFLRLKDILSSGAYEVKATQKPE